jgi:hypothetical protein
VTYDQAFFLSTDYIRECKTYPIRRISLGQSVYKQCENLPFELRYIFQQILDNRKWMYDWMDDLMYFEGIDFRRHDNQRILSWLIRKPYTGKGKVFVINKIIDYIQPKTVLKLLSFLLAW